MLHIDEMAAEIMKAPSIKGKNINLESFSDKFITEEYLSWLRDEKINKYLIKPKKDITLTDAKKYCEHLMKSEDNYFFAIITHEGNKHIGNVRLGPIKKSDRICQYSMMIGDKKYHRRGYASEAVNLSIVFCFETLKMHKLYLDVINENIAAIKLYEKYNFVTEGILKEQILLNDRYYDLRIMGLISPYERGGA